MMNSTLIKPKKEVRRLKIKSENLILSKWQRKFYEDTSPFIIAYCGWVSRHLACAKLLKKAIEIPGSNFLMLLSMDYSVARIMDKLIPEHLRKRDIGHGVRLINGSTIYIFNMMDGYRQENYLETDGVYIEDLDQVSPEDLTHLRTTQFFGGTTGTYVHPDVGRYYDVVEYLKGSDLTEVLKNPSSYLEPFDIIEVDENGADKSPSL